jgi:hypothetical protein
MSATYDPARAEAADIGVPTQRTATDPKSPALLPQFVGQPYDPAYRELRRQYVAMTTPEERREHQVSLKAHQGLVSRYLGDDHAHALTKASAFMAFHSPTIRAMDDMAWNMPDIHKDTPPWDGRTQINPAELESAVRGRYGTRRLRVSQTSS